MSTMIQDTIERQITVRAPKARVFNAIADPKQIVNWFPNAVEGDFTEEGQPIFDFGDGMKVQIHIVAIQPDDYFAYRWIPGGAAHDKGSVKEVLSNPNTLVEFRLEEVAAGTTIKLKESGFSSLPPDMAESSLKDNNGGWDYMLDRLTKYIPEE